MPLREFPVTSSSDSSSQKMGQLGKYASKLGLILLATAGCSVKEHTETTKTQQIKPKDVAVAPAEHSSELIPIEKLAISDESKKSLLKIHIRTALHFMGILAEQRKESLVRMNRFDEEEFRKETEERTNLIAHVNDTDSIADLISIRNFCEETIQRTEKGNDLLREIASVFPEKKKEGNQE